MKDINQIKIVITKFNEERILVSVYSKQNGKYITRTGKLFDRLDLDLFCLLNRDKSKVRQLVSNIIENNNEIVFNGKPQLHVSDVYYDKLLINKDVKMFGTVFKIKDKHILKEYTSSEDNSVTIEKILDLLNEIVNPYEPKYNSNEFLTSEELDTTIKINTEDLAKWVNKSGIKFNYEHPNMPERLNEYNKVMSEAIKTRTRKNVPPLDSTNLEDLVVWMNKSDDFAELAKEMGFNIKYEDPNVPETLKTSEKNAIKEDIKHVLVLDEYYSMLIFDTYERLLEFIKFINIDFYKINNKLNYEVKGLLSESYKMLFRKFNIDEKVKFYYAGNFVKNNTRKVVYKKIS